MTGNDEQLISDCLDLILTGKETVENLEVQYPHLAQELRELVESAELFQQLPDALVAEAVPSAKFQAEAKSQLLKKLTPMAAPKVKRATPRKQAQWDIWGWLFGRHSALTYGLGGMMILFLASGSTLYASNNAIPGDTLYGIKNGIENYRLDHANSSEQIDLHLSYADKRLGELESLATRSRKQYIKPTSLAYAAQLEQAVEELDDLATPNAPLVGKMGKLIAKHQVRLTKLDAKIDQLNVEDPNTTVGIEAVHQALNTGAVYLETGIITSAEQSLWEIIENNDQFSRFRDLVGVHPDLRKQLIANGPFTLFLPTNEAFVQAEDALATIQADPKRMRQLILYHYLQGKFSADTLTGQIPTALGVVADFTHSADGTVTINSETHITSSAMATRNGMIYIIDHLLIPIRFP